MESVLRELRKTAIATPARFGSKHQLAAAEMARPIGARPGRKMPRLFSFFMTWVRRSWINIERLIGLIRYNGSNDFYKSKVFVMPIFKNFHVQIAERLWEDRFSAVYRADGGNVLVKRWKSGSEACMLREKRFNRAAGSGGVAARDRDRGTGCGRGMPLRPGRPRRCAAPHVLEHAPAFPR
ncbi:hypothetical protein P4S83_08920 [Aneurinibacillus thermoaerophilus]|uniref:hypothetical protein n=1 Tax=Aneurinibacillus thermoaerophilus TaxID=143495 RepID=UPI002E209A1E|nr:hypothetical protein [Aneurinibacillus thermoaerophilus]MED0763744.1 hypothetical protein [Aneurinibacillus thermoaerophilus]